MLYGLRYDVFDVPSARPFAANKYSQDFTIDKNNFGPRAGLSWAVDPSARTVVRASTGLMYEPPLLDFYDGAILNNGDPASFTVTVSGTSAGAPAFPTSLANVPPSFVLPRQSITVMDPDFKTQSAWLSNVQIERALNNDLAVSAGYVNSIGRNLPLLIDVNLIPTAATLPDGRPIYSTTVSAATRVDPTFNQVNMVKSIGESTYNAFTATMTKRMTHGWMAQATYTLARGEDNAPLTGTYVVGSQDDRVSDPSNLDRDKGLTPFNQTAYVLALDGDRAASVGDDGRRGDLEPQPGRDHPAGEQRAAVQRPLEPGSERRRRDERSPERGRAERRPARPRAEPRSALLALHPVGGVQRAELFFEAKNLFNTENIAAVNRVVTTDALGNPTGTLSFRGADYPTVGQERLRSALDPVGIQVHLLTAGVGLWALGFRENLEPRAS